MRNQYASWTRGRELALVFLRRSLLLVAACALGTDRAEANHIPYAPGNILAGVGNGQIKHFTPSGTLLEILNNTTGSQFQAGMCFDAMGNLYSTNFSANSMSKFNNQGGLLQARFISGFNQHPESCVFDAAGNVYVGQADGLGIRKFTSSGTFLTEFSPATQARGTDWIDLAADQCTMFYTSEGSLVKRYNVCTRTQLADFATAVPGGICFALRIRPNGEVLVACTDRVVRLSSTGTLLQTYLGATYGETGALFALNLDPDNVTFWTAGIDTGNVRRINIQTGTQVTNFNAGILSSLGGLAIFGEQVVAQCTVPAAPVNPGITPVGNPSGPVTGIDFLNLSWSPPASGTTPTSYDWRINGDPFSAPTTATSATAPPRGSNSPITLQVRARACTPEQPGGAADSPTYSPAPPVANFSASGPISAGASVTFTDTSTPQATSWLWLFGDGQSATTQSTTHTFANRGIYSVVLIASNGAGSSVKTNQQTVQSLRPLQRRVVSTGSFDSFDPERQRLSGVRLARTGETWLTISSPGNEVEVIVYLRFLDEEGTLVEERRLSIAPGQDALYDLAAYGLTGTYSLGLVSTQRFTASLVEVAAEDEARGKRDRQ